MDRSHIVNSVITIVATVSFTELVRALISFTKKQAVTETAKQAAKKTFSRDNLAIVRDVLFLALSIVVFVDDVRNKSPVTRLDIVFIPITMFGVVLWLGFLVFDVGRLKYRQIKERLRKEAEWEILDKIKHPQPPSSDL